MKRTMLGALLMGVLFSGPAFAQVSDTTPPAVVAFDFTPKSVDVSAGPATVTVTLRITDDLAGFGLPPQIGPSVGFRGPGTGGASCGGHTLIEGTDRDQVWSCTVTIPQFAQPGVWQAVVNLSDLVGNNKFYEPQDLQAAGFPVDLRVGVPAISINNVTLIEGGFGVRNADFMVTLSFPSTQTVTMNYVTAAGTARAWIDYVPRAGTLTFLPGTTTKKVTILVWGERLFEPDETFFVNLSGAINGSILDGQGLGTILNDDPRKSPGR